MPRSWTMLCIALLVSVFIATAAAQSPRRSALPNNPIDQETAVSFFWFGDMESHFRRPMNFYIAESGDPRLHTVSMNQGLDSEGHKTWVTASEMKALLQKIYELDVDWTVSPQRVPLKTWPKRTDGGDGFSITVLTSKGTANTRIRIARMCDMLLPLDAVMPTPRIRWQFQTLRWDDGCIISGYENESRPPE